MAYHTAIYLLIFLPVVLILYQLTPQKYRWIPLLGAGYVFFWSFSEKLVIYLIGTTLFTHYIGMYLNYLKAECKTATTGMSRKESAPIRNDYKKKEKLILTAGIVVLLGILGYLKYFNFFVESVNRAAVAGGGRIFLHTKKLILPIGISFYTLQAIGYMADVYWEKIEGQQPLRKVALFLSFFPQIMEGPIAMYDQTADALWRADSIRAKNLAEGTLRILWGLFKKMLIADRLNVFVDIIFENFQNYHGSIVALSAIAYTIQLYMEFSGCMDMVIGSGQLFGVTLPENFRRPFVSRNAAEFWRRWHITLGAWFKAYVFYPVSVSGLVKKWNKFGRKHLGKYVTKLGVSAMALFPVWLCNGLWHGAKWRYIFYGMYYFVILMIEVAIEPVKKGFFEKTHISEENPIVVRLLIFKTWLIIFTGELFFRAKGVRGGLYMFRSIFYKFEMYRLWDGSLLEFGLDQADIAVIVIGCIIVAIVGMIQERNLFGKVGFQTLRMPVRWAVYYGLIIAILVFGAYGMGYRQVDLIYAGF